MNEDLDRIEEKLKAKKVAEEKTRHKVSGKSVFKLQQIIQEKSKVPLKEGNADSKEPVAGDE